MNRYIVGLDFGTHQTKVCIEDAANQLQLMYEFLEFPGAPKNTQATLFPSVVQINNDGSVSYGFVDKSQALVKAKDGSTPPTKKIVQEPAYWDIPAEPKYEPLPQKPEPKYSGYLAILAKLLPDSEEMKKWKQEYRSIERANENRRQAWLNRKNEAESANKRLRLDWESRRGEAEQIYEQEYKRWQEDIQQCIPMRFRYFKQATFFYRDIWSKENIITPEEASIWYLAYIKFILDEKLGKDYVVRMGVPCSYEDVESFKNHAYSLWTGAEKLVNHYGNLSNFLKADYKELLQNSKFEKILYEPSSNFDVRTEAQASLFAAVSNKRLETRINLLFDIGGGTTDVAVFQITSERELKILETISIPKGLNYIFEEYLKDHNSYTLEQIQERFAKSLKDRGRFDEYIDDYLAEINSAAKTLSNSIVIVLCKNLIKSRTAILNTLKTNPSVFCGGGSMYPFMRNISIGIQKGGYRDELEFVFTDKRVLDKDLLGIQNVKNRNIPANLYQILATSYGLSLNDNWFEVPSENIMKTFKDLSNNNVVPKTRIIERNDDD